MKALKKPQAKRVMDELLAHDEDVLVELRDYLSETYNTCGPDLGWGEKTPSKDVFVGTLRDLAYHKIEESASPAARSAWKDLSSAAKRALCLSVGP